MIRHIDVQIVARASDNIDASTSTRASQRESDPLKSSSITSIFIFASLSDSHASISFITRLFLGTALDMEDFLEDIARLEGRETRCEAADPSGVGAELGAS
jgi:hypothetical protein